MNYLKSLIQTTGSLRPSVLSCVQSVGLAAEVNPFFYPVLTSEQANGPFLSFSGLIT